jgi:serine/threonine-protein phosphatase PP1 catalytic subunit
MNKKFGFHSELHRRFKNRNFERIYEAFNKTFDCMPIAGVVEDKIFCCHGGIGPGLKKISQINNLQRPMPLPDKSDPEKAWAIDVLWSGKYACFL